MGVQAFRETGVAMPDWVPQTVAILQLLLNAVAVIGGAVVWKLYVANLRAAVKAKDATIETVEKSRDLWKDKAQELEKRSPEVVEKSLAERIQIRDAEIARLRSDKEIDAIAVRTLEMEKAEFEQDLFRTKGFRAMLALEEEAEAEADDDLSQLEGELEGEIALEIADAPPNIEVARIGEVGVDSGQLMVTDPAYIDNEWQRERFEMLRETERTEDTVFNYSYDGACHATLTGGHGQLAYRLGHAGAGVAFSTAWGDGVYPVYAEKHDGRIVRVYVNVG